MTACAVTGALVLATVAIGSGGIAALVLAWFWAEPIMQLRRSLDL